MHVAVALEQVAAVVRQRAAVRADHAPHDVLEVLPLRTGQDVLDRRDERRVADDPQLAVDRPAQLRERAQAVLRAARSRRSRWRRFICLPEAAAPEALADARDVEARVPDVDVPHLREARHRLAVLAHRRRHDRAAIGIVEAAIPARDREARGEPLHVPLERPRQRLVEVVDAEDEPPIGRGEDAEVREVRVAAELRVQARPRPVREVGRHQVGGAAEEGERRREHPPVPDRAELGKSRLRLLLEEIDRVTAHRRRLPLPVRRARHAPARGLATGGALGRREMPHPLGRR